MKYVLTIWLLIGTPPHPGPEVKMHSRFDTILECEERGAYISTYLTVLQYSCGPEK